MNIYAREEETPATLRTTINRFTVSLHAGEDRSSFPRTAIAKREENRGIEMRLSN